MFYLCENDALCDRDTLDRAVGIRELAMAYDSDTYTLLKHGEKSVVEVYANNYSHSLDIDIITFNIESPLEEINKTLTISGYIRQIVNPR